MNSAGLRSILYCRVNRRFIHSAQFQQPEVNMIRIVKLAAVVALVSALSGCLFPAGGGGGGWGGPGGGGPGHGYQGPR